MYASPELGVKVYMLDSDRCRTLHGRLDLRSQRGLHEHQQLYHDQELMASLHNCYTPTDLRQLEIQGIVLCQTWLPAYEAVQARRRHCTP